MKAAIYIPRVVDDQRGYMIVAKRPFNLEIEEAEDGFLCIDRDDLGLVLFERNWDRLEWLAHDQLLFNWREYAKEDDANLSPGAIELKQKLLETFDEVPL